MGGVYQYLPSGVGDIGKGSRIATISELAGRSWYFLNEILLVPIITKKTRVGFGLKTSP